MIYKLSCLLLLCLAVSFTYTCDDAGYASYLTKYPFKQSDPKTEDYQSSLKTFKENCSVQGDNEVGDDTVFLDWTDEDLLELGDLSAKFLGIIADNEPLKLKATKYRKELPERTFDDNFVAEYSTTKKICSTSWATSAVRIAELAVNNQYKFSAKQLLECLPKEYDIEKPCMGVESRNIMLYLGEIGLVQESDFTGCDNLENQLRFKFDGKLPFVPNKSGLMNLVADGTPAVAMVALNMLKLRYVKTMNDNDKPLKCADYEPSVFGIVNGYDTEDENPYWEITTNLVPAEEIVLHLPMSANETNPNYAGIAGYAFTLEWINKDNTYICNKEAFTTLSEVPADATTLILSKDSLLTQDTLDFSRFPLLKSLIIEEEALPNTKTLIFKDLSDLESINVGWNALSSVTSIQLANIPNCTYKISNQKYQPTPDDTNNTFVQLTASSISADNAGTLKDQIIHEHNLEGYVN